MNTVTEAATASGANPTLAPAPEHRCPSCGGANACAVAAQNRFDVACWCREIRVQADAIARLPADARGRACLCISCATAAARSQWPPT